MRTFTRSAVTRLLLPSAAFLVHDAAHPPQPASAAVKFSSGMEEVRKAASLIPGYGPPDIAYAAAFRGRWRVRSRVVDVKTPLGEDTAPADQLQAVRRLLAAEAPLEYEARFLEAEGNGGIVLANEKSDGIALAAKPYAGTVIADRACSVCTEGDHSSLPSASVARPRVATGRQQGRSSSARRLREVAASRSAVPVGAAASMADSR